MALVSYSSFNVTILLAIGSFSYITNQIQTAILAPISLFKKHSGRLLIYFFFSTFSVNCSFVQLPLPIFINKHIQYRVFSSVIIQVYLYIRIIGFIFIKIFNQTIYRFLYIVWIVASRLSVLMYAQNFKNTPRILMWVFFNR